MERPLPVGVPPGCRWLDLLTVADERGMLAVAEEQRHVPFRIGSVRWGHDRVEPHRAGAGLGSLRATAVVALKGTCDVAVATHGSEAVVRLHRPDIALSLPSGAPWSVERTSPGAVWLALEAADHGARRRASSPIGVRSISLPSRRRAGFTVTEAVPGGPVPFPVRRVYFLYDLARGAERGGHAHRELEQVLVAAAGSFDVVLHDGRTSTTVRLDRPDQGFYVTTGTWRELKNFSPGAVCLALASLPYDESDYIRKFEDFVRSARRPPRGDDRECG